jgi:hypothetical protein
MGHSEDAVVLVEEAQSIYQCYSQTRRVLVLIAVCLANILPPFADMVYVPALPVSGTE